MDFFAQQDRARRQTGVLLVYFLITLVLIVLTIYVALIGILSYATSGHEFSVRVFEFHPKLFAAIAGSVTATMLGGCLYKMWELGNDGANVATELGGRRIPPNSYDLSERILLNVVEEMALASGTPVPPVFLLDDEIGINAFAAGTTPQNAVIGITRGAVQTLSRDELQGVIAHEFSHILNGDMRLNQRLIGLLFGIMAIAMIGYLIIRIGIQVPGRASDDDGKGALAILAAIFAIGGALIGIGYVGVFFANLIQAAVSRQREYLADASAVQFTRNPLGIADALKKVGGWTKKSTIKSVYARETSHMFFAQGLTSQLFATHPPLAVRIQRIDPSFKGEFEKTEVVEHTQSELVDLRQLRSGQSSMLASAHVAALAGVDRLEQKPQVAVSSVGDPKEAHMQHAHRLVGEMNSQLVDEVRDPLGAISIVYGMLLASSDLKTRADQLSELQKSNDQRVMSELNRLLPTIDRLEVEQRLPIACMALPAVGQLSKEQLKTFQTNVTNLINWDQKWTIFEYALQRFITKRLVYRDQKNATNSRRSVSQSQLDLAFGQILSTLAHFGASDSPIDAYKAGVDSLNGNRFGNLLLGREQCTLKELDSALNLLENTDSTAKKQMLNAFSACIAQDKKATITEVELLRVISDALGCPMPPVLDL